MYGSSRLFVHLSILFNLFITHCHLPATFMQSIIVPLVKCKAGDLTDLNNYKAIALSNSLSKVLETLFLCKVSAADSDIDKYQFGFKAGQSTGMCTNVVKNVVDYYTNQGSHVFLCLVDFSQTFD